LDESLIDVLLNFSDLERHSQLTSMKTSSNIALAVASIAVLSIGSSFGAMVPAGTILVVRTVRGFTSIDAPGTPIPMELANDVVINGKVILAAGTKIKGEVATSKRTHTSTQTLRVDITSAQIGGRSVPIKTTGAAGVDDPRFKGRGQGRVQVSGYSYPVPSGTRIGFRLAQPLNL
jgi:hypothetical protein